MQRVKRSGESAHMSDLEAQAALLDNGDSPSLSQPKPGVSLSKEGIPCPFARHVRAAAADDLSRFLSLQVCRDVS